MNVGKMLGGRSFVLGAVIFAAAPLLISQPAYAGHWGLTGAPTGGFTYNPVGSGGGGPLSPAYTASSMSFDIGAGGGGGSLTGSVNYTGTIAWVPNNGDLAHDPAPVTVTITEYSYAASGAQYGVTRTTNADNGLGDAPVTTYYTGRGIAQQTVSGSKTAAHVSTVLVAPGGSVTVTRHLTDYGAITGGGSYSGELSYSIAVQ
ncbi:MAG: hypothetical protein ABIY70_14135 [Capsulimonas sp.]|uniref:hypothetical protein n=1 Tax=Capsulimonas sp. TaxID=2494211 RepID=UPI003267320A